MSDVTIVALIWIGVAGVLAPIFGKHLQRIDREQRMVQEVRKGLDSHYRRSGRPGMAHGRAFRNG